VQADHAQAPVQDADVGGEEDLPDDGHNDRRQHHRDDEQRADRFEDARVPVQEKGRPQAEQELGEHGEEGQPELHAERIEEPAVLRQLREVRQRAAQVPPRGRPGQVERREARQQEEGEGRQRHHGQY